MGKEGERKMEKMEDTGAAGRHAVGGAGFIDSATQLRIQGFQNVIWEDDPILLPIPALLFINIEIINRNSTKNSLLIKFSH